MEGGEPPYSARAVAEMSLHTDAGEATVEQVCRVFGLSRSGYYAAKAPPRPKPARGDGTLGGVVPLRPPGRPEVSVAALEAAIRTIVKAHPAWGVRKVWATLRREPYGLRAGHKRVWALMRALGLCLPNDGEGRVVKPMGQVMVEEPNRRWATDLTTVWTERDGLVAVMVVIDCGCRTMLAVEASKSQESAAVLAPVHGALEAAFGTPDRVPDGLELRSDHGPQYTGDDCWKLCRTWGLDHTFAPVGRPTGNAGAERVIRTMKEECIWLRDWTSRDELQAALQAWKRGYNEDRPHQALCWQTPAERRIERLGTAHVEAA